MQRNRACPAATRARLEMQGFVGLDDERLSEARPWLRLAPTLCAIWVATGTLLMAPALFWSLMPLAALGSLRRGHPFDALYNHVLRHLLGTRPLPPYGAPRRFACGVATVWIAATGAAFALGTTLPGLALGAGFVLAALVPATTDFCIPSFFFGLLFGQPAACAPRSPPEAAEGCARGLRGEPTATAHQERVAPSGK